MHIYIMGHTPCRRNGKLDVQTDQFTQPYCCHAIEIKIDQYHILT